MTIQLANPFHDARGRFSSEDGATDPSHEAASAGRAEREAGPLRDYLQKVTAARGPIPKGSKLRYAGLEDYLSQHGQTYRSARLTPSEQHLATQAHGADACPLGQCFRNAQRMVMRAHDDRVRYAEGYVKTADLPIPIHHAWATVNGKVVDPTLKPPIYGVIPKGVTFIGAEFPWPDVAAAQMRSGAYSSVFGREHGTHSPLYGPRTIQASNLGEIDLGYVPHPLTPEERSDRSKRAWDTIGRSEKAETAPKKVKSLDDSGAVPSAVTNILGHRISIDDLAEAMVSQVATGETFTVTAITRGGLGEADLERLHEEYDAYVEVSAGEAMKDASRDFERTAKHVSDRVADLWNKEQQTAQPSPYGDVSTHPTLPGMKLGGEPDRRISFTEAVDGVDIRAYLGPDADARIRENLRGTAGVRPPTRGELRALWSDRYGDKADADIRGELQPFRNWKLDRGYGDDSSGSGKVSLRFYGSAGTAITRTFRRASDGDLLVSHDYFSVAETNAGLGKQLFRGCLPLYERLGVDRVDVHANISTGQGGFSWARFGFLPDHDLTEWLHRQIDYAAGAYRHRITEKEAEALHRLVQRGDPKSIWRIAAARDGNRKLGYQVLQGTDWEGHIDMHNEDQLQVAKRYVGLPT